MIDLNPIWLTMQLAFVTTLVLLFISIPLSYWLYYSKSKIASLVEVSVSLPLILPPTVIGFYVLLLLSPDSFIGAFLNNQLHLNLLFSFEGLVIASVFYSLPFMVNPILSGFKSLNPSLREASFTLGKSNAETLYKILIPNIKTSIYTGIVMTFAHTMGEFGVVLMVGGSIPNETRLVSITIYDEIQAMNYDNANTYALILFCFSFLILLLLKVLQKKSSKSIFF